ncbi:hypothetical protein H5A34_03950 [Pectobacterium brasiliense]|uniref:hypothetical protein n=1 Tax=Pectobacterium brasiliense TaxID=180957 RepID=UPI0019692F1B|nr:hypothetical protein [Pectobacterium brasiliense]MBN3068055.1 hypothetical protein [Pectobacterium brasiliense]MBN3245311.1 hypothetical protein [Pectobacterium brasiliense]
MSHDNKKNEELIIQPRVDNSNYGVIIPCEPRLFGDFISKLLGKPQTIEKFLPGEFKVEKNDIISIHHLIKQRIDQQNESELIQFSARMFFSDDSSVEVNSISEFEYYNEIKRVNCTKITLNWIYLINFKNKNTPEKQQISITLGDSDKYFYIPETSSRQKKFITSNNIIFISIQHTERTWGVDIESLLTKHIENFQEPRKTFRQFIHKHRDRIGVITGSILFSVLVIGAIRTTTRLANDYSKEVIKLSESVSGEALISKKIDYLLSITSTGVWPRLILGLVLFLVISIVISIIVTAWVAVKAELRTQSWILITENSKNEYPSYLKKLNKNNLIFFFGLIVSISTGIIGNFIFAKFFASLV